MSDKVDVPVPVPNDAEQQRFGYGHGGVPLLLLLFYLGFLCFFTWYTLEYQLPDFMQDGPGRSEETAPASSSE